MESINCSVHIQIFKECIHYSVVVKFLIVNFLQYSYSYIGLCYIVYKLSHFLDLVALV